MVGKRKKEGTLISFSFPLTGVFNTAQALPARVVVVEVIVLLLPAVVVSAPHTPQDNGHAAETELIKHKLRNPAQFMAGSSSHTSSAYVSLLLPRIAQATMMESRTFI